MSAASTRPRGKMRKADDSERERRREQKIAGQRTGHAQKVKEDIKTFIGGFGFEFGNEKIEQPALRVGNALRVGFEIDGRNGGTVLVGLVGETVHVGGPEHEVLTNDEFRVDGPAADGCV